MNGLDLAALCSRRAACLSSTSFSVPSTTFVAPPACRTSIIRTSDGRSPPTNYAMSRTNQLFEIYNGHPEVNNAGGGGVPGMEEVWDRVLSGGTVLFGIAVDDAHHFKRPGNPTSSGRGVGGCGAGGAARAEGHRRIARARRLLRVYRRGVVHEYAASSEEIAPEDFGSRPASSPLPCPSSSAAAAALLSEQTTRQARATSSTG